MKKLLLLLTIVIGLLCTACQSETKRKVQNIETFAKLYGYARWFHPSNEAQEIDWDKFAVLARCRMPSEYPIQNTQKLCCPSFWFLNTLSFSTYYLKSFHAFEVPTVQFWGVGGQQKNKLR